MEACAAEISLHKLSSSLMPYSNTAMQQNTSRSVQLKDLVIGKHSKLGLRKRNVPNPNSENM